MRYFILLCCILLLYSCSDSQKLFKKSIKIDHIKDLNTVSNGFVAVKGDHIKHKGKNYWRYVCKDSNQIVFDGYFNLKEDTLFFMPYHSVYQGCFDEITFYVLKKRGVVKSSCKIDHANITLINADIYFSYLDTINREGVTYERFEHQLMISDDYNDTSGSSIKSKRIYSFNLRKGVFLDSTYNANDLDFYWFGY